MRFPFTASENTVSIFIGGNMLTLSSTQGGFTELREHLKGAEHDADLIEGIIDRAKLISRETDGSVTIVGNTVYYRGAVVRNSLTERLIGLMNDNFDVKPWLRFMNRIMSNRSERSRECLFDFIDRWQTPLTEDGCFIAFKVVGSDFKDLRTHTFDNSPGQTPEVDWDSVDPDPNVSCSYGLHVAASKYLEGYSRSDSCRYLAVKVAPEDVVAVPYDYNLTKMRVRKYHVIGELAYEEMETVEKVSLYPVEGYDYDISEHESGFDRDGFDQYGYDEDGFDQDGYDNCGYDGYDLDRDGFNYDGFNDRGYDKAGFDENGYNRDGLNRVSAAVASSAAAIPAPESAEKKSAHAFVGNGRTFDPQHIVEFVGMHGQREFARVYSVPRSTLQGWLKVIANL